MLHKTASIFLRAGTFYIQTLAASIYKMDKSPLKQSVGEIKFENEVFEVSKAEIAYEIINNTNLLYISAVASHYELHNGKNIDIQDLAIRLLMPTAIDKLKNCLIDFPKSDSNHPEWEKTIFSNIYRFEHLIITECQIYITMADQDFRINLSGKYGEGIDADHSGFEFEATFIAQLNDKIDRNRNFFLPN